MTFTWQSAKSATQYKLIGDGVDGTTSVNTITVDGLVPGSEYTFTVWAVGSHGLVSNNITCAGSTGISCGCEIWRRCFDKGFGDKFGTDIYHACLCNFIPRLFLMFRYFYCYTMTGS